VIGAVLRAINDSIQDDAERTRLLAEFVEPEAPRGSSKVEARRAWIVVNWDIRERTPILFRALDLLEHADALAALPEIVDKATADAAIPICKAAAEAARQKRRDALDDLAALAALDDLAALAALAARAARTARAARAALDALAALAALSALAALAARAARAAPDGFWERLAAAAKSGGYWAAREVVVSELGPEFRAKILKRYETPIAEARESAVRMIRRLFEVS
jgi:hypothetical protein